MNNDYLKDGLLTRWPTTEELISLLNEPWYTRVEDFDSGILRRIPMPRTIGGVEYNDFYDPDEIKNGLTMPGDYYVVIVGTGGTRLDIIVRRA